MDPTRMRRRVAIALVSRLALPLAVLGATATETTLWAAPAAAQAGACGGQPCGTLPPNATPCGNQPCGTLPPNATPCGNQPCGTLPPDATPCGAQPCGPLPAGASACGDQPCGALPAGANPNDPSASAPATPAPAPTSTVSPGSTTTTTVAGFQAGQSALDLKSPKTSSSDSGWVLPVALVALAGLVFFWLVRRQRRRAETSV